MVAVHGESWSEHGAIVEEMPLEKREEARLWHMIWAHKSSSLNVRLSWTFQSTELINLTMLKLL